MHVNAIIIDPFLCDLLKGERLASRIIVWSLFFTKVLGKFDSLYTEA